MKHLLWTVPALLLGLVLGSWGPRADLRQARAELRALERGRTEKDRARGSIDRAKSLLGVSDADIRRRATERAERRAAEPAAPAAAEAPPAPSTDPSAASAPRTNAAGPMNMEARIEQASELWNARATLARSSLISNVRLDDAQAARFDVLVAAMNIRLEDSIEQWAGALQEKESLSPEDGVRLVNDLSTALVLTYDEMDGSLPETWRAEAGANFSLLDFVDPAVALPLVDVEDKLPGPGDRRRRPLRGAFGAVEPAVVDAPPAAAPAE